MSLKRLFKIAHKSPLMSRKIPDSAKRAVERSNQSRPFTIDRDAQGTRPWHNFTSKKPLGK